MRATCRAEAAPNPAITGRAGRIITGKAGRAVTGRAHHRRGRVRNALYAERHGLLQSARRQGGKLGRIGYEAGPVGGCLRGRAGACSRPPIPPLIPASHSGPPFRPVPLQSRALAGVEVIWTQWGNVRVAPTPRHPLVAAHDAAPSGLDRSDEEAIARAGGPCRRQLDAARHRCQSPDRAGIRLAKPTELSAE